MSAKPKRAPVARTQTPPASIRVGNCKLPIAFHVGDDECFPEASIRLPLSPGRAFRVALARQPLRGESSPQLYLLMLDQADGEWITRAEVDALAVVLPVVAQLRDRLLEDYERHTCQSCGTYEPGTPYRTRTHRRTTEPAA